MEGEGKRKGERAVKVREENLLSLLVYNHAQFIHTF